MMKKLRWCAWRVVVVGALLFTGFVTYVVGSMMWKHYTAQSKAKNYCEAAVQKESVEEIRQMYFGSEPIDTAVWRADEHEVRFMAESIYFLSWYDCVITLDENGKPVSQEVVFVDG